MKIKTKGFSQIWRRLLQDTTILIIMDIHHHRTVELDIPLRVGIRRLAIPRQAILLTVDILIQPILIRVDTPLLAILAPIITLAMDTDMDTVWVDCWLVEQLLLQLLMALTILLMHVHLGSATESSNMENLVSVGSMEASSGDSRNGSDEFATTSYLMYIGYHEF
uniref:Uncharacterized protein n=1 Tax=Cucumis melo TaxID=3656 RepID=A0A9I9CNG0_CUCME